MAPIPIPDVGKVVYWHRDLPPVEADAIEDHALEAASARIPGTIAHRDELWDRCYQDLMVNTERRLEQEVARLGGHFAHVLREQIEAKHDDVANESWLSGRFDYVLLRAATAK